MGDAKELCIPPHQISDQDMDLAGMYPTLAPEELVALKKEMKSEQKRMERLIKDLKVGEFYDQVLSMVGPMEQDIDMQ